MTDALAVRDEAIATPAPMFGGAQMVRALAQYRELQHALDASMPDQLITLDGKTFRKKGYWRAIAVAFNLTVEPVTAEAHERTTIGDLDDGSPNYLYSVTYRAKAATGRSTTGDGACSAAEKTRGRLRASEHNVRSHAHTRAFNRAVSNLVGFGEVSAEEVEREHEPARATAAKPGAPMPRTANLATAITAPQRARLFAIAADVGWTKDELKAWLLKTYNLESTSSIDRADYERIIAEIQAGGTTTPKHD